MKTTMILIALFFTFAFMPASATIINIPSDYPTIHEGINASTDRDTVLVQPGTYVENINFGGRNIVLGSLFLTTGDTSHISQTIIDGDESGSVVTFESGEDSTAAITGFTLQNGNANCGGGIYCSNSSPTIMNNKIQNCTASSADYPDGGGGIYCRNASPVITNNTINENLAYRFGGGIFCYSNSSPIISYNTITQNSAYVNGGGIHCSYSSSPEISHNSISGNYNKGIHCHSSSNPTIAYNIIAENTSNGILLNMASPLIAHNVIIGNQSSGIFVNWISFPTIANNTIVGNSDGIYISSNCAAEIFNAVIWDNNAQSVVVDENSTVNINYSNIQGGWDEGDGNIDVDPLFRDPENGDFHLQAIMQCNDSYDSPCIDAGDPTISDSTIHCDWGLGAERSDMGAYGGGRIPTNIDEEDIPAIPAEFILSQNYPNPFNAATSISYSLPESGPISLSIYDLLGRRVETLVRAAQQAGYHQVVWDASEVSSGMYFYRIEAGEFVETKKMLLLK